MMMIDAGYILNHSYGMHMITVTMLQVRSNQDMYTYKIYIPGYGKNKMIHN